MSASIIPGVPTDGLKPSDLLWASLLDKPLLFPPSAHSHGTGELPVNIAFKDQANTFTANQTVTGNITASGNIVLPGYTISGPIGNLNLATPYAANLNFSSGQSGQYAAITCITAEGKTAGLIHWDIAHSNGRRLDLRSQPAVPITIRPGDFLAATFGTDLSVKFAGNVTANGTFSSPQNSTGERFGVGTSAQYAGVAIGYGASAGWSGIAIGFQASTASSYAQGGIAIGYSSYSVEDAVALGPRVYNTVANTCKIGDSFVPLSLVVPYGGITASGTIESASALGVTSPGLGAGNWWRMRADNGSACILYSNNSGKGMSIDANAGLVTVQSLTSLGNINSISSRFVSSKWESYGQASSYDTTFDGNTLTCNYSTLEFKNNWGMSILSGGTATALKVLGTTYVFCNSNTTSITGDMTVSGSITSSVLRGVVDPTYYNVALTSFGTGASKVSIYDSAPYIIFREATGGGAYLGMATNFIMENMDSSGAIYMKARGNFSWLSGVGATLLEITQSGNATLSGDLTLTDGQRFRSASNSIRLGNYPEIVVTDTFQIQGSQQRIIFGGSGAYARIESTVPFSFTTLTGAGPQGITASDITVGSGANVKLWADGNGAVVSQTTGGAVALKVLNGWGVYFDNSLTVHLASATAGDGAVRITTSGDITANGDLILGSGSSANVTKYVKAAAPTSSGYGNHIVIQASSATTAGTGGSVYLVPGVGAGGPGAGTIYLGTASSWVGASVSGTLTVTNNGPNTGTALNIIAGGSTGLAIYWDNLTPYMQYSLAEGRQSRFVNSSSYTFDASVQAAASSTLGGLIATDGTTTLQMRVGWAGNYADSGQIWHNGTTRQIISSDGVATVGNIMVVGDYLVRPIDHGNSYMRFTGTGRRITEIVGWDEIRFGINGATNNVDITATGASFIGSITTTQAAGLGRATLSADGGWGAIALYYGADGLNMYVAPGGAIYHDASTDLIYRNGIGTIENARLSSMGDWTTRGFITSVIQSLSTDPTGSDLTSGQTRTIKNTSTGTTKVWLNDGGAFKSLTFV